MIKLFSLVFLAGCSIQEPCPKGSICTATDTAVSTATTTSTQTDTAASTLEMRGEVVSAFAVTVDGQPYQDLEAFYLVETGRLPARAAAAGYPGYTAVLDAQIGLQDLWNGMTVYVQSTGAMGYAARTNVLADGTFEAQLGGPDTVEVRANKRIALVLTKGDQSVRICYNFSANAQSVVVGAKSLPVKLSDFSTELTNYACDQTAAGAVEIPQNPNNTLIGFLRPDVTLADVEYAFGPAVGTPESDVGRGVETFTWYARSGLCETPACTVTFSITNGDASGDGLKAVFQSGVKAEYLDPNDPLPATPTTTQTNTETSQGSDTSTDKQTGGAK